jgi:hypothetical protein
MQWCLNLRIKPGSAYENTWIYHTAIVINLLQVSVRTIMLYLVECKLRFFSPETGGLIKWGCLEFTYEVLNRTAPDQFCLNWTMINQTNVYTAKQSCQICTILGYYAVYSCNSLPTFRNNLSVSSLKVNKSRRENRARITLTGLYFLGLFQTSNFLRKHDVLETSSVSIFRQRST